MEMAFWVSFWGIVLVVGLAAFAVLAVLVTVGGFGDARAMFRRIEEQHKR